MTSATNTKARPRERAAFTLIELVVSIGIIGLLAGILVPAVGKVWDRSIRVRTQADLQAIATALEAYKADFNGYYPQVNTINAGAAVLGKALLGPGNEARYYTEQQIDPAPAPLTKIPDDTLQNPPDSTLQAYAPSKVYQAGDIVRQGPMPDFADYVAGRNTGIWVCLRTDTQADGTARSPSIADVNSGTSYWWTPFLPYDGADGNGIRTRLGAAAVTATGAEVAPHAASGKVYGPYLDAERFKTNGNGTTLLDRWGSPILYFPTNKGAVPTRDGAAAAPATAGGGFVNRFSYPRVAVGAAAQTLSLINANDNIGPFVSESMAIETPDVPAARMKIVLGDYNVNGVNEPNAPIGEPPPPNTPYVLWSGGKDRFFGPRGQNAATGGMYSLKSQDFYNDNMHAAENAATAAQVDDVTNFR